MESVTMSRTLAAQPDAVREAMADVEAFMAAGGFDEVRVDGETVHLANRVGLFDIELSLVLVDDPAAALAYEQRDGIFEDMRTVYTVAESPAGTEVTATTEFALDVAIVGEVLTATIVKRQRRRELAAQFDWLEAQLAHGRRE